MQQVPKTEHSITPGFSVRSHTWGSGAELQESDNVTNLDLTGKMAATIGTLIGVRINEITITTGDQETLRASHELQTGNIRLVVGYDRSHEDIDFPTQTEYFFSSDKAITRRYPGVMRNGVHTYESLIAAVTPKDIEMAEKLLPRIKTEVKSQLPKTTK